MFHVSKLYVVHTDTQEEARILCNRLEQDRKNDPRLAEITNTYFLTDMNNIGVVLEGEDFWREQIDQVNEYLREVTVAVEMTADQTNG